MIAVDTNIVVYAHRPETQFAEKACLLLAQLAQGLTPWSIPTHCLHEFMAVVSNSKIWKTPSSAAQIRRQIDAWIQSPSFVPINETSASISLVCDLMAQSSASGGMIHDARIVAACVAMGVQTLYSVDRDFSRYSGLRIENPFQMIQSTRK